MSNSIKNDNTDVIEDLIITDDVLNHNNTFSLRALDETLEKLSVTNFWSLYQTQRSRLKMKRFCLKFSDFLSTKRLSSERNRSHYPRRYMGYIDFTFIEPELRKRYRNSNLYGVSVNQEVISKNPDIFRYNYLVFINGEFIFTTEVYPSDSKLGVIIDLETQMNEHGITLNQYNEYKQTNPNVDILIVPNFTMSNVGTNKYVLDNLDYKVPFDQIVGSENFGSNTICFANTVDGIARRYYEDRIHVNMDDSIVEMGRDITPGEGRYRFVFVSFNSLYRIVDVSYDDPYFKLDTKMPCPVEQMVLFKQDVEGRFLFNDVKITLYYPNVYKIEGLNEGDIAKVLVFQDEQELTESEKYKNDIAKYEEYVDMLPKYKDGTIPELLKHYKPSSFVYSIDDYENSMYVPNTLNYKVQKLHKTIYENPWALAVYLDLLNLPTDKFYVDMEKIDLSIRLRTDTTEEDLLETVSDIYFDEEMYVFAMNRHFVNTSSYGFRIFIDGYFQNETTYRILPGKDFYYIYLPKSKINEKTVVEFERYKLFNFEQTGRTSSLDVPVVEISVPNRDKLIYSREVYVVDKESNRYLSKYKDFYVETLYSFAESADKWVKVPRSSGIPIDNKIRIYLLNDKYLNKDLKIGVNRTMHMISKYKYRSLDLKGDVSNFVYKTFNFPNSGGYDKGGYRMFCDGKLMIPNQYFIINSKYQGLDDVVCTNVNSKDELDYIVDRVPARFTVVYYQKVVDEVNKKGFVDLDGKVPLPISLKWYDIFINGVKLHKKNIEIISPTKFYIQGVESRKNLIILMKNRDPEFFKLATHKSSDVKDYNNTIIDDLMETVGALKEIIDDTKDVIDKDDTSKDIITDTALNQEAIEFFYEFLVYSFINANRKQITQEIKDTFPSLVNEDGVLPIDPNDGCVKSDKIKGYLIKLIECNILDERSYDMFSNSNVDYDELGTLQDRFAIRPLDTTNHEFGLEHEFMCDPETGEPAIKNDDNTVTAVSTIFRTKNFIESFSDDIMLYGMGKADVYQITFDDDYKVFVYTSGDDIISEEITTNKKVKKFAIGLDATFMRQIGNSQMLKVANCDPTVTITYLDGSDEITMTCKLTRLHSNVFNASNNIVTLKAIKLTDIDEGIKTFIHSLLFAF